MFNPEDKSPSTADQFFGAGRIENPSMLFDLKGSKFNQTELEVPMIIEDLKDEEAGFEMDLEGIGHSKYVVRNGRFEPVQASAQAMVDLAPFFDPELVKHVGDLIVQGTASGTAGAVLTYFLKKKSTETEAKQLTMGEAIRKAKSFLREDLKEEVGNSQVALEARETKEESDGFRILLEEGRRRRGKKRRRFEMRVALDGSWTRLLDIKEVD